MTGLPARPAVYIRDADAAIADDSDLAAQRDMMIGLVQGLGWPGAHRVCRRRTAWLPG